MKNLKVEVLPLNEKKTAIGKGVSSRAKCAFAVDPRRTRNFHVDGQPSSGVVVFTGSVAQDDLRWPMKRVQELVSSGRPAADRAWRSCQP